MAAVAEAPSLSPPEAVSRLVGLMQDLDVDIDTTSTVSATPPLAWLATAEPHCVSIGLNVFAVVFLYWRAWTDSIDLQDVDREYQLMTKTTTAHHDRRTPVEASLDKFRKRYLAPETGNGIIHLLLHGPHIEPPRRASSWKDFLELAAEDVKELLQTVDSQARRVRIARRRRAGDMLASGVLALGSLGAAYRWWSSLCVWGRSVLLGTGAAAAGSAYFSYEIHNVARDQEAKWRELERFIQREYQRSVQKATREVQYAERVIDHDTHQIQRPHHQEVENAETVDQDGQRHQAQLRRDVQHAERIVDQGNRHVQNGEEAEGVQHIQRQSQLMETKEEGQSIVNQPVTS